MCFGRWDTPQHVLIDDTDGLDFETSEQIWPGGFTSFDVLCVIELRIVVRCRQGLQQWSDWGLPHSEQTRGGYV